MYPYLNYEKFDTPAIQSLLLCVGYNHSYDLMKDHFLSLEPGGIFRQIAPKMDVKLRPHRINGGAFCYGDSGCPLWVYADKNKKDIPVQMGVYSYMPWGTCTGRVPTFMKAL